jgi:beta-phosphoglucomutase-like phosphatase (HAD superfamily)
MKAYIFDFDGTLLDSMGVWEQINIEFKLGIATSLPAELYEPALRGHGIKALFNAICSTDEIAFGKSGPEIFLHTAEKLDTAPEECVVFEDILQAIQSAKLAGMTVYGVYDEASKEQWAAIQKVADGVLYNFKDAPLPE